MLTIQPFLARYFTKHMINFFYFWGYCSRLKQHLTKPENGSITVLKGAQVAVCGIRFIDLISDELKILNTHFCYNKKLEEEKNFCKTVTDIRQVLQI